MSGSASSEQQAEVSAALRALVLPEGHLPIVAAAGQQPRLGRVPGHTVDILGMGSGHVGHQGKGGLLWLRQRLLLKDPDGIVSTGCGQCAGQVAPVGGGAGTMGIAR